jgi:putative phosphoesterase
MESAHRGTQERCYTGAVKLVTQAARVALKPGGQLTLGVVADTHSHPHARGLEHLAARRPDVLLHAGDIGDAAVLEQLRQVAPVYAVRGNIDSRSAAPDVLNLELVEGDGVALRVLLTHIALGGPRLRADARRLAKAAHAQLVVCGHSHVPFLGQEQGLTVFNPGSIGPRRFTLPILFGVVQLGPTGVTLEHVDCETGQRWLP